MARLRATLAQLGWAVIPLIILVAETAGRRWQ